MTMQTADQLNQEFAIPGVLSFCETHPGMVAAEIASPACAAQLYLQGAHLTQWQPARHAPVLFVAEKSAYAPGKAIRGGVPVIFPWFGAAENSPVHPPAGSSAHGFARTGAWSLRFAAMVGEDLHLSFSLDAAPGQGAFGVLVAGLDVLLGSRCEVRLTVGYPAAEGAAEPILFEEALHTYFHVGDAAAVSIDGLQGTEFLDKTEDFRRKTEGEAPLRFEGETDRMYLNTSAALTLHDPALRRSIHMRKTGSETTVIWNPAAAVAGKLADLGAEAWTSFACMETANAGENAVWLSPGQAHSMGFQLSVEAL